ncbi:MAG: energy-coupling factor transporter ATPase [Clostridia bacterium]
MSFIELKNLHFSYKTDDVDSNEVLHGIDLNVEKGEFVALLGHNGCGKSTLAKIFNGMYQPSAGTVIINGIDATNEENMIEVRKTVGLVQQNPDNQLVAAIVEEDVAFGPENLGVEPSEIRKRVDNALKTVNMYHYKDHAPHKLSGGQKQRIAIAGVLAMETSCIVLDEPTAMLDPQGRVEVIETIKKLNTEKGITVIFITHYMDEAVQADRVVVMDGGNIISQGKPRDVFSQVEFLKKHRLSVPQATELAVKLKENGIDLGEYPMNTHECIALLEKILKKGFINQNP